MKRPVTLYLAAIFILSSCSNPGTAQTTQAATTDLDLGPVELIWSQTGGTEAFVQPSGLAVGASGELYVTDTLNHKIRVLDAEGQSLNSFGELGSGEGKFNFAWKSDLTAKESLVSGVDPSIATPFGIFVDAQGNIYTTDYLNNRVLMLDSSGQVIGEWGRQGKESGLLYGPVDIVVDSDGNIYVSETYNNRVQKFRLRK